jgi:preprotein translocase subunit YajC
MVAPIVPIFSASFDNTMLQSFVIFAQDKPGGEGSWLGQLFSTPMMPFLLIAILFMVLMVIMPERRRRKEQQTMMSALKVKDRVLTIGGVIGVISNISEKEDEITIRLEEGRMRVTKGSIARVLKAEESVPSETIKKS